MMKEKLGNSLWNKSLKKLKILTQPRSLSRFTIVGVINTAAGIGLFPFVNWLVNGSMDYHYLLAITYITCSTLAFCLHRFFTFESRGSYRDEIMRYVVLSLVIFALNYLILNVIMAHLRISVSLAQTVLSTLIGALLMVANYLGLNHLVFQKDAAVKNG